MLDGTLAPDRSQTPYTKGSGPGETMTAPASQSEYSWRKVHLGNLLAFRLGSLCLAQFQVQHDDRYEQHQFDG